MEVTDEAQLEGVEASQREFFAATAQDAGKEGWLIPLGLPTVQPILEQVDNPQLRARIYAASVQRGGEHNRACAQRMALLRAEKAQLCGYPHYAEWVAAEETAGSYAQVRELLDGVIPAAVRNAQRERSQLEEMARAAGRNTFTASDWPYYARRLQESAVSSDPAALSRYFTLTKVVEQGLFRCAEHLYGLRFSRRPDIAGYAPGVDVWEVVDGETGEGRGLLLTDFFTRPTKRGGAWMNSIVDQCHLLGQRPVVIMTPPTAGEEVYLTMDEVETLFHEFGHALHGLLSDVTYPLLSGAKVPRDFVEFPSPVNEMWALHPDVVSHYARTDGGESLSEAVVQELKAAQELGQGFSTVEYLAACIVDLAWHTLTVEEAQQLNDDAARCQFEEEALRKAGLNVAGIAPRYRTGYFQHIFSGGYGAAYYSYLWVEVLDADTEEWFNEQGGLQPQAGRHFRDMILSRGGSIDYMQAYCSFRGRDKDVMPLLRRRGLASSTTSTKG